MKLSIALTLTSAAFLLPAGSSHAQVSGYIGGTIGQSTVGVTSCDHATSGQFFGGVNLARHFGLEAAYTKLGKFNNCAINRVIDINGFEITAVRNFPIYNANSVFVEAGLYSWKMDIQQDGIDAGSDNGSDLTYGIGARFLLTESLRMHLEYQVYTNISNEDIDTLNVGFSFGL